MVTQVGNPRASWGRADDANCRDPGPAPVAAAKPFVVQLVCAIL